MSTSSHAECVLLTIDASSFAETTSVRGVSALDIFKRSCCMLAAAKLRANPRHVVGVVAMRERAELVLAPSKDPEQVAAAIQRIQTAPLGADLCELGSLADAAHLVQPYLSTDPWEGPPRVRVILFYCRSATIPTYNHHTDAALAVDALYVHERPVAGANCPQEVFCQLEAHCDLMSRRANHLAYILPCSIGGLDLYLNQLVWMLCHPAGRIPQAQLNAWCKFVPPNLAPATGSWAALAAAPAGSGAQRAVTPQPVGRVGTPPTPRQDM